MRKIQNSVTQQDEQLLMFTAEHSGKRSLSRLDHDSFPHPLPKLLLCGPELFTITTNDKSRFLLPLLLPGLLVLSVGQHLYTPPALHVPSVHRKLIHTETP